jgi:hypothetical protein
VARKGEIMKCNKFSLDLMHFSTNEFHEIKDIEKLKEHLRECADCREKLKKLKDVHVFTFLAKPRSDKFKRKMKALINKVKAGECGKKKKEKNADPFDNQIAEK